MKKIIIAIILLVSAFFSVNFSEDSDKLKLVIAGDENYAPLEYVDENGIYKGFNVDLIRAIGIELGLDIEIIPMKWDDALNALKEGKVDAIQGMNITDYRRESFDFTSETLENSHSIFVSKENLYVREIEDLKGRIVAIQEGDVVFEGISDVDFQKVIEKNDQVLAIEELINSNVDAFIGNTLIGKYYLQKTNQNELVKIAGRPLNTKPYAIAVKKGDSQSLHILEDGLNRLYENGTYDKIYIKWFGEDIDKGLAYWKNVYEKSIYVIVSITIVLLLISWVSLNMKKEISDNKQVIRGKDKHIKQYEVLSGKIVASMISGCLYFDKEGALIIINESAKSMLKDLYRENMSVYDIEEILNIKGFDKCKEKKLVFNSVVWQRYDDRTYFFNYNYTLVESFGNIDGVLLVLQDYTQEHKYKRVAFESEKMKSIGTLTASIAHELRNPLTAIKIFTDMMDLKKGNENFYDKLSSVIPKEVNRMDNLIVQLLDYSKPRVKNMELFKIHELTEEVIVLFKMKLEKKNIRVSNNYVDLKVYADKNNIKQVLINILLNSIYALDKNGHIKITYIEMEKYLKILIEDNGCGIEKDKIDKVFEPFFTSKSDGYGIGLSVCYQLIVDNNGEISIDSEISKGTMVKIILPRECFEKEYIEAL